jgi:hypothetical protein
MRVPFFCAECGAVAGLPCRDCGITNRQWPAGNSHTGFKGFSLGTLKARFNGQMQLGEARQVDISGGRFRYGAKVQMAQVFLQPSVGSI